MWKQLKRFFSTKLHHERVNVHHPEYLEKNMRRVDWKGNFYQEPLPLLEQQMREEPENIRAQLMISSKRILPPPLYNLGEYVQEGHQIFINEEEHKAICAGIDLPTSGTVYSNNTIT